MIRIDSLTYFNAGMAGMRGNQEAIARLNQQIASGERLLAPKDDPIATGKVMDLSNRIAQRTQYAANQDRAEMALKYQNVVIQGMSAALQRARGLLTSIDPDHALHLREAHAVQLRGVFNQVLDLANTRDAAGNYLFGGFVSNPAAPPWANAGDGGLASGIPLVYDGAATQYDGTPLTPAPGGTREIEIDAGRRVQVSDHLDAVLRASAGAGATAPAGEDILQKLDAMVHNLPGAVTQADISALLVDIEQTVKRLERIEHRIAGALSEIADARATNQALLLQDRNALGDLRRVDQAAAIVELQSRQTVLEAAGRAYARTANLSLFNFL